MWWAEAEWKRSSGILGGRSLWALPFPGAVAGWWPSVVKLFGPVTAVRPAIRGVVQEVGSISCVGLAICLIHLALIVRRETKPSLSAWWLRRLAWRNCGLRGRWALARTCADRHLLPFLPFRVDGVYWAVRKDTRDRPASESARCLFAHACIVTVPRQPVDPN